MSTEYIQIMIESLKKKDMTLSRIIEMNKQQKFLLQDPNLSPEDFEKNMQYKAELIEQLNLLDNGFEELYARVRDLLTDNREQYATEIAEMQELIREITDKLNQIQVQEQRNKEAVESKLTYVRKQVRGVRNSQKVVKQYYDNMVNRKSTVAYVVDDKK